MKKLFPIFLLLVFGFAACTGGEGAQYAGKYKGTFTFIKQNGRTKPGTVAISNNPLSIIVCLWIMCPQVCTEPKVKTWNISPKCFPPSLVTAATLTPLRKL